MAGIFFKPEEKQQSRKNLKIDKDGVAALRARQMNFMQMNPMRGGGTLNAWGDPTPSTQMRNPFFGGDLIVRQGQQTTHPSMLMGNPFFGPFLMSPQGQMIGPRMTKKGGGFTPGYDPWSLRINTEVAKKLEDQPNAVALFG